MSVPRPMTPEAVSDDAVAALTELADLAASLEPGEWSAPTDCPGWDVHDVVAHVVSFEAALDGAPTPEVDFDDQHVRNDIGRMNEAWIESLRSRTADELLDDLRALADRRRRELAAKSPEDFAAEGWSPAGTVPFARFLQVRTFDVWFHEQDVREAVGRPGGLDGPVAERALTEVLGAIGFVVGKRGGAPDGSSVRFELSVPGSDDPPRTIDVAVEGRARVVDDLPDPPTTTIATDLPAFIRLAGGRRSPQDLIDAGRVRIEGDAELGERIVRNLAYVI
ncbi:maleylpyruvate isomerase family mycothiol-dependent enzyme [Dermatobacter hominis]|uniref:maleylpyruvate isomerase family mycothiol-dependent enzyme n=1 Tax=Dermatobacter hominis TaxID=2884263 RepID=UPI001D12DBC2|nr:maleylpyruvate isomerase family mycothiol-dependent enzyme [Dermatobacter hominis]UDY36796.1 maleylpyruvate isomerase family mycothiol-dependent enzyme [Dermatobacter hominis]